MRPEERDAAYLWDMLNAARDALDFTRGHSYEQFRTDRLRQSGVERKIEIIGEAARRLSEGFRQAHPELPWRQMIGQRNVLAHEYDSIRVEVIWRIVSERLPELVAALEALGIDPSEPSARS